MLTPTGRPAQKYAGACEAVVVLGPIPMAYRVDLRKSAVWYRDDAEKCPSHEAPSTDIQSER